MSDGRKREPLLGPKQPGQQAEWLRLAEASSVGLEIGIAIAIGWFGGRWLENSVTHWAPWTSRLGLLAGFGAAVLAIVRTARKFTRQLAAEEQAGDAGHAAPTDDATQSHDRSDPKEP